MASTTGKCHLGSKERSPILGVGCRIEDPAPPPPNQVVFPYTNSNGVPFKKRHALFGHIPRTSLRFAPGTQGPGLVAQGAVGRRVLGQSASPVPSGSSLRWRTVPFLALASPYERKHLCFVQKSRLLRVAELFPSNTKPQSQPSLVEPRGGVRDLDLEQTGWPCLRGTEFGRKII